MRKSFKAKKYLYHLKERGLFQDKTSFYMSNYSSNAKNIDEI